MGPNQDQTTNNRTGAPIGMPDIFKLNPNVLLARLSHGNPAVQQVVNSISGMSPEQAFSQYGYDYNQVREDIRNRFGIEI